MQHEEAISKLKEETLSALTVLYLHGDRVPQVPVAKTVDDFDLCRAVKEKGKPTGNYVPMGALEKVKDHLVNWDSVYIQFRDESGTCSTLHLILFTPPPSLTQRASCTGDLQPVEVEVPVLVEDDEEEQASAASSTKGKRKTPE